MGANHMQKVIGVSLGNNTSAAVIDPVKGVELAISEERLNGEKNTKDFPINALRKCVDRLHLEDGDPVFIGISSYEVINDRAMRYIRSESVDGNDDIDYLRASHDDFYSFLENYIRVECNISQDSSVLIERADHHTSHMLPAVLMSGFLLDGTTTIAVTYDGFGDGICGTITNMTTNEVLAKETIGTSLGLVYQYVTGALGFREHQHEGKITGLAAFGEPEFIGLFKNIIDYDEEKQCFVPKYFDKDRKRLFEPEFNHNIHGFDDMLKLKNEVYFNVNFAQKVLGASKENIAASVQLYTEELITKWINGKLAANNIDDCNITLSGGLFANVKVNYAIKIDTGASKLFVLPPMGDEGTAIGAALNMFINKFGRQKLNVLAFSEDKLYQGTIKPERQKLSIDNEKYKIFNLMDTDDRIITNYIPELLANKRIVCISRGYSEFGPRALGNHSILFDAGNKETNDTLNAKLGRNEFMPFAPITLNHFKDDLFFGIKGLEKTLKYMTVSVPVKQEFMDNYKAAYHVDGTARPQILHEEDNYILYNIIKNYTSLSYKKVLINTSFNLHNSPIIFDDKVAYESFEEADLDALLLNDKLIVKRDVL